MSVNRSLEDRIRAIEDRLEIYNLIASHPPSADTAGKDHIAASWVEDGVFDRGENLSSPRGRDSIANQVRSADHQAAIERGLAHYTSLPHVAIEGDTATVTSYLQILVPQTQGDPVDIPNHGSSKGFRVHRMTANRWELGARRRAGRSNAARCVNSTARSPRGKFCGRRLRGRATHCGRSTLLRSPASSSIQIGIGRPTPAASAR
jgi:hypothetical protein